MATKVKFPKEKLITEAVKAFEVQPYVAAGAFVDAPAEMTMAEAKKLIDSFQKREVK
ncbi:MAG: hypothetical protein ACQ5SW_06205 [Sphaerochaetaceae bacterium]